VVPEDLGVSELLQLGQNSLGSMDYDAALAYFQAVIDRYSSNTQALVNAQYEIAHTHYKQGNYEEAEAGFRALLARYEESNVLPQQFKVLSEIGLEKLKKN
jgi:TolA-binding protein